MAKRKAIIVTAGHEAKRWTLKLSGTDREARKAIVAAVMVLQGKGFVIVNGAPVFGDDPEPKKRGKKGKAADAVVVQAELPQ